MKMIFKHIFVLGIIILITSCGNDGNSDLNLSDALNAMGVDQYMGIQYENVETANGNWNKYYYSTESCRCFDGSQYSLTAKEEGSDNVILFLGGGGACWPGSEHCNKNLDPERDISSSEAFWLKNDPANPLAGWNAVYLPYCDGSAFAGDNYADYDADGTSDSYHWGLRNLSAGITLMVELFPDPDKILISGMSGGGYGTIIAYSIIRQQYPDANIYIFSDSGPGLFNPDNPDAFALIKKTWNLEHLIPDSCSDCNDQFTYFFSWYLNLDPQLRVGMFSFYQDFVIGLGFLGMALPAFEDLLMEVTDDIDTLYPDRFNRFFIDGNCHTVANYCPDQSTGNLLDYEVDGTSLYQWLGQLVDDANTDWSDLLE